jgi:putative NIF3 family GTP cyclohydrolase 1 type 2
MKTLKIIVACLLIFTFSESLPGQNSSALTAGSLIETIIKHTGSSPVPNTVDVIKAGDPMTPVKGIITTMFPTMEVLKKAVDLNCNLIIVHEPSFYNHRDETAQFRNDPVFNEKRRFIDENKLVIWRFHDYIHSLHPDGMDFAMSRKLGWQKYLVTGSENQFVIPETTLMELVQYLKKIFPKNTFNIVGRPEMKVSKIRYSAGAPGSMEHITLLEDSNIEVIIGGEVPQWETYEYVRDAVSQGRKKAIIFLGHITSEEPGMEYAAEWLKTFIKDIPVRFVESGPSYWTF